MPRFQFTLRTLFYAVTAAAAYAGLTRQVGWLEAAVLLAAALTLIASIRGRHLNGLLRTVTAILAATVLWFVGVDFSYFADHCDDCGTMRLGRQVRLLGFTVWEAKTDPQQSTVRSQLQQVLAELNLADCPHSLKHRELIERYWGLVYFQSVKPRSSVARLVDPFGEKFDKECRERINSLIQVNPALRDDIPSLLRECNRDTKLSFARGFASKKQMQVDSPEPQSSPADHTTNGN